MTIKFDLNSLSYREGMDLEKYGGVAITDIGNDGVPLMGLAAAFAWIVERRTNPGLTFDEFIDRPIDIDLGAIEIDAVPATPTNGDESKPSA